MTARIIDMRLRRIERQRRVDPLSHLNRDGLLDRIRVVYGRPLAAAGSHEAVVDDIRRISAVRADQLDRLHHEGGLA